MKWPLEKLAEAVRRRRPLETGQGESRTGQGNDGEH